MFIYVSFSQGRYNGGPEVEYAAVSVLQGKRYRFRLINISVRSNFVVSIDNRESTVSNEYSSILSNIIDTMTVKRLAPIPISVTDVLVHRLSRPTVSLLSPTKSTSSSSTPASVTPSLHVLQRDDLAWSHIYFLQGHCQPGCRELLDQSVSPHSHGSMLNIIYARRRLHQWWNTQPKP
jgi:hypothetical protein